MRVILFTNNQTGEAECFSSLKPFFEKYPKFEALSENIQTYLSRKKIAFETDEIKVQRLDVQRSL
jgi:myosin-crossreactive antigen